MVRGLSPHRQDAYVYSWQTQPCAVVKVVGTVTEAGTVPNVPATAPVRVLTPLADTNLLLVAVVPLH